MPKPSNNLRVIGLKGVIRPAEVDDALIPDTAVSEAMNIQFDRKGVATVRAGIAALGSTVLASRPCVGLHNTLSNTAIAVFSNGGSSTIYSFGTSSASGAWAVSLDGGTASVRIRFTDFAGYTITPNFAYNTLSSMRFWDGGTRNWKNTGNPINPQNMWGYNPQLIEVYKSKVYVAGDPAYPSRLFFSSVISSAGNITWSPTSDFVDINPGDGEDGTALKRFSLELLYFKPNYIYRFKTSGLDPDPLIRIGTRSQESVIEGKRALYFHHDTGFYAYTGSYPTEISRPISDFIKAIPYSQYANVVAWKDEDHIYWSVGNLTINDIWDSQVWKNVVLRFTESSQVWTIYSYSSDPRRGITYNNGSSVTRILGLDNGVVTTLDSGTTDVGEMIKYRVRTKWYEFEDVVTTKVLKSLATLCDKAQGAVLQYQIDDDTSWRTIGQIKKFLTKFFNLNIKFYRIRFQITGDSRSEAPIFRGIEIIEMDNQGVTSE